jgi:hypothetical protein
MLSFDSSAPTTKTMTLCPVGTNPSVYFADINNDKKLDLVVLSFAAMGIAHFKRRRVPLFMVYPPM